MLTIAVLQESQWQSVTAVTGLCGIQNFSPSYVSVTTILAQRSGIAYVFFDLTCNFGNVRLSAGSFYAST
jgi:hypothetical protein